METKQMLNIVTFGIPERKEQLSIFSVTSGERLNGINNFQYWMKEKKRKPFYFADG